MPICFCLETIFEDEQAILTNFTNRNLLEGPVLCLCLFPWVKVEKVKKLDVKQNQYVLVRNTMDPSKDRHEYGPKLLKLKDAYEVIGVPSPCPILDQVSTYAYTSTYLYTYINLKALTCTSVHM